MSLARVVFKGPTNVNEDYIKNTKWRKTCVYQPRESVRNFQLDQCRFLVETEVPATEEGLASDYRQTENILNLRRHGMRYSQVPDHSEQNFSLMESDPRGYQTLPDLQRLRDSFEGRAAKYEYQFGVDGVENHLESRRDGVRLQADMQETKERFRRQFNQFSYGLEGRAQGGLSYNPDGTIITPDKVKGMRQMGEAMDDNTKQELKSNPYGYVKPNSEFQIGYYAISDTRLPISDYSQTPISGRQLLMASYHERKLDHKRKEQKERDIKSSMVLTMKDQINKKSAQSDAKKNMMQLVKASRACGNGHHGARETDPSRHDKAENMQTIKKVRKTELRQMKLDKKVRNAIDRQEEDRRTTKSRQRATLNYRSYQPDPTQDITKVDLDGKFKTGRETMSKSRDHRKHQTHFADYSQYNHDQEDNKGGFTGMARPSSNQSNLGRTFSRHGNDSMGSRSSGRGGIPNRALARSMAQSDSAPNFAMERTS
tara:strand:- start:35091 stop:36542 length:1452 start_codon:yes stop_codon:yes gene_type:complete